MKKIIFASLVALAGLSLVSCSKESTESKNESQQQKYKEYLVGKWKVIGEQESGNVYNCLYRIEGDYYVEFKSDGSAVCSGDAKAHAYYQGGSEFMTENVSNFLHFEKWNLEYSDVTQCGLWTYATTSATGDYHKLEFNSDGTVKLWYHLIGSGYYTLKKTQ